MSTRPTLYPYMQYRDAPAAIAWLEKAFGFRTVATHPDGNGGIAHAELGYGNGMIMLGTRRDNGLPMTMPGEAGGNTQGVYVVVKDADAVYARAQAAGAEVVMSIRDTDYGSRDFSVRDPEGHLWSFGTYMPDFPKEA
jgi:uncharacterized glyoxalase superfamily protein PhnB